MTLLETSQIIFYLVFSLSILIVLFLSMVVLFALLSVANNIKRIAENLERSSEKLNDYLATISIGKIFSKIFKGRRTKI